LNIVRNAAFDLVITVVRAINTIHCPAIQMAGEAVGHCDEVELALVWLVVGLCKTDEDDEGGCVVLDEVTLDEELERVLVALGTEDGTERLGPVAKALEVVAVVVIGEDEFNGFATAQLDLLLGIEDEDPIAEIVELVSALRMVLSDMLYDDEV
jgi:hypothetical protein